MAEAKARDPIPESFSSLAEAADFWDCHDLSEYLDQATELPLEVRLKSRVYLTALEPTLARRLVDQARQRGVTTETLINLWLSEKLATLGPST
jgi:CopG antitoxin of type II toxin-antitoxin system